MCACACAGVCVCMVVMCACGGGGRVGGYQPGMFNGSGGTGLFHSM